MQLRLIERLAAGVLCSVLSGAALANEDWVPIAPGNMLYMQISGGTVVIELHPEAAPGHVERIKELARAGFYDGLTFHRVIDDFMAQGGDPQGTGVGGSSKPDLKAEFTFHGTELTTLATGRGNEAISVSGGAIVVTEPEVMQYSRPGGTLQSWLPHCRGVVSMARTDDPDTANSQFFITFSDTHESTLNRNYTAWGRVVYGMETVHRIQRGEPPRNPTRINKLRVGSDMPEAERLNLETLSVGSAQMKAMIASLTKRSRGRLDACDIEVPVRLAPKPPEVNPQ